MRETHQPGPPSTWLWGAPWQRLAVLGVWAWLPGAPQGRCLSDKPQDKSRGAPLRKGKLLPRHRKDVWEQNKDPRALKHLL